MKKKQPTDTFDTQCWFYDEITDPFQVFAEVFTYADMAHFRNSIRKILSYAEAEDVYLEKSPCEILIKMRVIRSVINAAHTLKEKKRSPVSVSARDVFDGKYYRSGSLPNSRWKDFPRHLSLKEFCNPYKVVKKFFNYQPMEKWVHDVEEIVDCALSRNRGELGLNMLFIYVQLSKLVEAAHLINVREVTHVGGTLKNRSTN